MLTTSRGLDRIQNIFGGDVVEDVRKIFEQKNDVTIYIPVFYPIPESTII